MSNKIIIKHGPGKPVTKNSEGKTINLLDVAELGWDKSGKRLYVGEGSDEEAIPQPSLVGVNRFNKRCYVVSADTDDLGTTPLSVSSSSETDSSCWIGFYHKGFGDTPVAEPGEDDVTQKYGRIGYKADGPYSIPYPSVQDIVWNEVAGKYESNRSWYSRRVSASTQSQILDRRRDWRIKRQIRSCL